MPKLAAVTQSARRVAILGLATVVAGCAAKSQPTAKLDQARMLTPAERATNAASFDEVWVRVEQTYFRPERLTEDAVDWTGRRVEFRENVELATTQDAARAAMNAALATLGETHFAVAPSPQDATDASLEEGGFIGLELRPSAELGEAAVIVWRVEPDSPADQAGIKAGWQLVAIDRAPLRPIESAKGPRTPLDTVRRIDAITRSLAGGVGQERLLEFKDGKRKRRTVRVRATQAPDGRLTRLGNLPPMDLRVTAETLASGVGYFSLSVFLNPPKVIPEFSNFIETHADAPGIIIDLRGNPGGLGAMATGLCGFIVDRPGLRLGTMTTRDSRLQFVVNPRTPRYTGPVAVIVDGFSMSTSEILASGLQDLGRARIFGQPTPGAALPSTVMRLSNGDLFQYAVADYVSEKGQRLEGVGVRPDVVVPLRRAALLAERDEPLEAAIAWIRTQPTTRSVMRTGDERSGS